MARTYVAAYRLTERVPFVHAWPDWEWTLLKTNQDGSTHHAILTPCGRNKTYERRDNPDGLCEWSAPVATMLLAVHAYVMGARYCRLCWPLDT